MGWVCTGIGHFLIAFGKLALVTNSSGLLRRARRLHLLAEPYVERSRERIARALALHGQWRAALRAAEHAEGLTELEQARWAWLSGEPGRAADGFARASDGSDPVLSLCEAAARAEAP